MKRLRKKSALNYTNAVSYNAENEMHWSNIAANITSLPYDLQTELENALMNYTTDTSVYYGEHPRSICSNWINRAELKEKLDAQQMTVLTMSIIPEVEALKLGNN